MFKLVSGIVGIFGATVLFWCGILYEHRPANPFPNIPVHCCLFVHFNLGNILPESLAAKNANLAAELKQAQANELTLQAAISMQNAAIKADDAKSVAAIAQAETAIRAYETDNAGLARRLAAINKPLTGVDSCVRYQQADKQFMSVLAQ